MEQNKFCFLCGKEISSGRERAILKIIENTDEKEFFVHSWCFWNLIFDVKAEKEGRKC